LYPFFF